MAHRALGVLVGLAAVLAVILWTPMTVAPTALFFGLVLAPLVFLAGLGLYHLVHGARRPGV